MRNKTIGLMLAAAAGFLLAGCAAVAPTKNYDAMVAEVMKSSFTAKGIAKLDWLNQSEANAICSKAQGNPLPPAQAKAIEAAAMATVKMPANGKFIGDWKVGEKLAQSGKGMTWSDDSIDTSSNGGNCYNCHQLSKEEISFGTIGPSLYNYGKLRGVSDPSSAAAKPMVVYTWGKLYNAKAYNACSDMPRFGHAGMLSETQMQDLMALLLDPKSPVNQ